MEEKLRNLSQNIAANTGEGHQPKHPHTEETPPPEEPKNDPPVDEAEENIPEPETSKTSEEESDNPIEVVKEDSRSSDRDREGEQSVAGVARTALRAERPDDGGTQPETSEPQEDSSDSSSAKILSMSTDDEPQESPARTKKYSPEVEAALSRLNSETASIDPYAEPLSTEPKKSSHVSRIFLVFLLLLAVAAVTLCVLVEKGLMDNPLNGLIKSTPPSQTTDTAPATKLTPPSPSDSDIENALKELQDLPQTPNAEAE